MAIKNATALVLLLVACVPAIASSQEPKSETKKNAGSLTALTQEAVPLVPDDEGNLLEATVLLVRSKEASSYRLPNHPPAVMREKVFLNGLAASFEIVTKANDSLLTVDIEVPLKSLEDIGRGTYELLFAWAETDQGRVALKKPLSVKVEHPLSVLDDISPVRIESRYPLQGAWRDESSSMTLTLKSGPTIEELSIRQYGPIIDKDGQAIVAGSVIAIPEKTAVPQGETVAIDFRTDGKFPVGEFKGAVHLSANGMKTLPVGFEVTSRAYWLVVPAVVSVGLILGWVTRKGLDKGIAKLKLQNDIDDLIEQIAMSGETRKSKSFVGKQQALIARARQIRTDYQNGSKTADETVKLLNDVKSELADAIGKFDSEQAELIARLDGLRGRLAKTWLLPPAASEVLQHAIDENAKLASLIEKGEFQGVDALITSSVASFVDSLATEGGTWLSNVIEGVERLDNGAVALSKSISGELETAKKALVASHTSFGAAGARNEEHAEKLLSALHDASENAAKWIRRLIDHTASQIESVVDALYEKGYRKRTIKIAEHLVTLQGIDVPAFVQSGEFGRVVEDVENTLDDTRLVIAALNSTEASKQLALGEYRRAAQLLPPRRRSFGGVDDLDADIPKPETSVSIPDEQSIVASLSESVSASGLVVRPRWNLNDLELRSTRIGLMKGLGFLKTTLLWLTAVGIGSFIYMPTFVGYATEYAQLFFWGLSLDIAGGTVLGRVTAKKLAL